MGIEYKCISADSHVNVHPNTYIDRVPAKFKDLAPRVEFTDEGDFWNFEDRRWPAIGLAHMGGRKFEDYRNEGRFEEVRAGGWDPVERVKDLALDGLDAQILYGATGHIGAEAKDPALRLALYQAYHEFIADFNRHAPDRFKGVAIMPPWDLDVGLAELDRVAKTGAYGAISVPAYSPIPDKPYGDPYWDHMWSAIEDSGLICSIHLGARGNSDHPMVRIANTTIGCAEPFAILIYNGVLEKHPNLKLISAETGFGWWAYFVDRMDTVYRRHRHWSKSTLPEPPSTYVRRQVYITFQEDRAGMRCIDMLGEDNIMWADDYPHTDSTFLHSQEFIEEHFAMVPDKDRERLKRKITCENAGKLYGWIK